MIVSAVVNGSYREACWVAGSRPGFHCLPPSNNKVEDAQVFSTIEAAADFLSQNRSWGIRMRSVPNIPRGTSNAIYRNIVIDGKPR
ncbi:hypothetical protein LJR030_003926 [Rhizobium sp. LjRoot30]|uniref:hypothetical protein n=1 Tax=Rhizobium sp. LjRoot30 TaxID=3342320 RepID=UPI003ED146C3